MSHETLLRLTLTSGLGPITIAKAAEALGGFESVVHASAADLKAAGVRGAERIRRNMDDVDVEPELQRVREHGVTLIGIDEPAYPKSLRFINDPPPLLYVRGELTEQDNLALAIVGARRCTAYGREQADRFGAAAAQAGLCIISGGAYGIDAAAHRAALRAGGRTVAVLGSGHAKPYPAEHRELFDAIADGRGAVISEFPMLTDPRAEHFPRRNRLVSGMALGVLVIEAAHRSGALITARLAAEDHGREVMALPGRVDSQASAGCHKIIREGWATLVTSIADVLDALGETGTLLQAGEDEPAPVEMTFTDVQRKIVDALIDEPAMDALAAATGLAVSTLQAELTMLEIRGAVVRRNGKFVRKK